MRADRLVATLLLMQIARPGDRRARSPASWRCRWPPPAATWRRCPAAGIPVYPQPGRGGGWALVGGARTDLTGLTAPEAQALFLLAGPAAAVAPEVKSALRKLVAGAAGDLPGGRGGGRLGRHRGSVGLG